MQEKASNGDYILCWSMLILTLIALVLGIAFYLAELIKCHGTRGGEKKKTAVYEIVWEEDKEGKAVVRKWRYFVERETHQPRRIEKYRKDDPNGEYVLEETVITEYPTDAKMREDIKDIYK